MARPALWCPNVSEGPRLYADRHPDFGVRYRRQHGHLQFRLRRVVTPFTFLPAGTARPGEGLGMAIGLAVSLVFAKFLQKLLFGVSARDPFTYAAITGLLICVALLACWIPARRAMRADPIEALKSE
jgi:FtsX-like permease family protein